MDNVAVLIPCYNEELTIQKVVEDFLDVIDKNVDKVYVYNNNSTDKSLEILKKLQEKNFNNLVIKNEYKQGKGNVIRRMFREINANYYIMVDGDDTYSVSDYEKIIEILKNRKVDMVIGDRLSSTYFNVNKRAFHNLGNNIVKLFINLIYKNNVKDVLTGYRGFSYNFVKTFSVISKGFEIETEMTIHSLHYNMNVENVIIEYKDRKSGSVSKLNTFSDGIKVLCTIFTLFRNTKPFLFFSIISIILFLVALIAFIPIFIEFLNTNMVPKFPTLITSCFVFLLSIITFYTGVILQTIVDIDRKNFEMRLIMNEDKSNS